MKVVYCAYFSGNARNVFVRATSPKQFFTYLRMCFSRLGKPLRTSVATQGQLVYIEKMGVMVYDACLTGGKDET